MNCSLCSTDFVANPPGPLELQRFYANESYFEGGPTADPAAYQDYDKQTAGTLKAIESVLDSFGPGGGRSVLDIGCAYGTHLRLAGRRGWSCFGVEPSLYARQVAKKRLGTGASIVASVTDLVPHEFDLILLLDVIEHLPDPYQVFFELFGKGAITPRTRVVITTPNAQSTNARLDPARWAFRTPPAHLVYYSARSFEQLLQTLRFSWVRVRGTYPDVGASLKDMERSEGLRVEAGGSTFTDFMRERYVPGTWSRVAEFEHLPRYRMAAQFARGLRVLDLGCGTGYGAVMLAQTGAQVTALDIDKQAIAWARRIHASTGVDFQVADDLGESLPDETFDLVTCFEMIEHVDELTQHRTLASLARLLKPTGLLMMSTPNPEVTKRYGLNPFHLKEMTLPEFHGFLSSQFDFVRLVRQSICVDVSFSETFSGIADAPNASDRAAEPIQSWNLDQQMGTEHVLEPVAWIAMCSATPWDKPLNASQYRSNLDYVSEFIDVQAALNGERLAVHEGLDRIRMLEAQVGQLGAELADARQGLVPRISRKAARSVKRLTTRVVALAPARLTLPALRAERPGGVADNCYQVRMPVAISANRYRVLHVIANLMTGGSSRLVIDLIEHLGDRYEQAILTSFVPTPAAYSGPRVVELPRPADAGGFRKVLNAERPDFLHVHWWGSSDTAWYEGALVAAAELGIPIIENVNTPVRPRVGKTVRRYVYVSDQIRKAYGRGTADELTIYPGSDFSIFRREPDEPGFGRCVGMVYRLERDKLDEKAIEPFIELLSRRPDTQALIVGGGSLLAGFRERVSAAGLSGRFEFTDYVAWEALPDLYRRMSVFVAPVHTESFGQVSSFAMNMGVPVCGYDVGALSEVIGGHDLLAPAGDAAKLAKIIDQLLDSTWLHRAVAEQQGCRARELFSLPSMIRRYADLYARMTEEVDA